MSNVPRKTARRLLAAILCVATASTAADAADVSIEVSSREVYVNVPFVVSIAIENAQEYEPPRMPRIDGLRVVSRQPPATSSFTQIINGRMTQRQTVTLRYQLLAERAGTFTIPPIPVVVDGAELRTKALQLVANATETTDLLFVEVKADREVYYLGERIDLTLEIWLRPYRNVDLGARFDEQEMAQCISRGSSWGVFSGGLNDIKVREGLREDREGLKRAYFVYLVPATITPQQTGTLPFDDLRVIVDYPARIRRSRGFFDRGWETTRSRPLVGKVDHAPIRIVGPPAEGQPASFAGAVGRFQMEVAAKPTEVAVGDPITLSLTITDRTPGGTELDLLKPPPLDQVPALVTDFRIPTDPLAGVVDGRRKTFTQTIRARNDQVAQIPPISFSYFDPEREQYVTLSSDPIDLDVHRAVTLSDAEIVDAEAPRRAPITELTEVAGGILANYTGPDVLLTSHESAPGWVQGAVVGGPPVLFVAGALGLRRSRRLRDDRGYARRRQARRSALRRLAEARGSGPPNEAVVTSSAVSDYVADRCNLPAGALTSAEVVERLESRDVDADLVDDIRSLLDRCEELRYAGGHQADTDSISDRAARCIELLEKERIR